MSKVFAFWALLGVLMLSTLAVAPSGAVASSPSERACIADGGTYTHPQGVSTCTYPTVIDPVGNSENSDGKSQETVTTSSETGRGNTENKNETSGGCEGPKGQCK